MNEHVHDCIIIGAGPGGLQAAIYLGRYNRDVLLLDRSGGRTWHAPEIENVLTNRIISGREIIERGMAQARSFNVRIDRERVLSVRKEGGLFRVVADEGGHAARFVIAASGVYDKLPRLKNLTRFLGRGYYTCIDCDGYRMAGKKVVVTGDEMGSVNIAVAVKLLFTQDVTYLPWGFELPESAKEMLKEEGIAVAAGEAVSIMGHDKMEGLELSDGRTILCEAVMASFGVTLNDAFLAGLDLKRDSLGSRYVVSRTYESSVDGLYIVGPLNTGQDQVVIAAGEGATAAIEINRRLLQQQLEAGAEAQVCTWRR
jgi:thioredoxin reductase (NADPH)